MPALYSKQKNTVVFLADFFKVSRPTVYKVIQRARLKEFIPRDSSNQKYRCLQYGIRRLAKVEARLEAKLKANARRYNKQYPGENDDLFQHACMIVIRLKFR